MHALVTIVELTLAANNFSKLERVENSREPNLHCFPLRSYIACAFQALLAASAII